MKYALRMLAAGLVLGSMAGCSDSPEMLFHDWMVFWNEIADTMLRVNDEESAKEVMDVQFKQYKARFEVLKERTKKRTTDLNKTEKQEFNGAYLDYYDEFVAANDRLKHGTERLNAVIAAIKENDKSASTENLVKLRDMQSSLGSIGGGGGGPPGSGGTVSLIPPRFSDKDKNKQPGGGQPGGQGGPGGPGAGGPPGGPGGPGPGGPGGDTKR